MELKDVKKPESNLYSLKEVSEFMGISRMTLYRMINSGIIKVINTAHVGKKPVYAFKPEDVQAYYDQNKQGSIRKGDPKSNLKEVVGP